MGVAVREGYWANCFPHVFHVSFLFSVCIRSKSIFLKLFLMMLSVCFYIRYITNLFLCKYLIWDLPLSRDLFLFSSPQSPVIGLLWNFRGQLNGVYSENLKLLVSDGLGYPRPARKNSNGPCDLDIWPIHTSSHASYHLVSNREIIHLEQYMM